MVDLSRRFEFKLLVPFTEEHAALLVKNNIIIKRGGKEAAEIKYIHITKLSTSR